VPFPLFLFRKLAAAAPPGILDPAPARSLQHVLDYAGNISEDISAVFRVDALRQTPQAMSGGERVVSCKTRERVR
jgi:hypothetical protein